MAKKLWGGRFSKKTDPLVEEFTRSIYYDYKLAKYDLIGSMAHVHILNRANLLTSEETNKLQQSLSSILKDVSKGTFKPNKKEEDIHTQIQNILQKKVGNLALKLHTARSRNDQVVFATKVYCKSALSNVRIHISKLIVCIDGLAMENSKIIIPGFTHMQHAQPVRLVDYLNAYREMLKRDNERLDYIARNMKISLGAGALAGTPIDAKGYNVKVSDCVKDADGLLKSLEIKAVVNSLDTVSDRDFVIEILSALSIVGMHLSRLSEDLIMWSTKEFDFVEIDEAFCTGSSLMPHKKNPDVLELIRGYTGRLYGNLFSVLTVMKGLPLTYNRDMQLDKEPLFDSFDIVAKELKVLKGLIESLKFNEKNIKDHLKDESLYATDLMYYLVDLDIPFKNAHTLIGKLVKYSIDNAIAIKDMPEEVLKKMLSKKVSKKEIVKRFDPKFSVESKRSVKR